MVQCRSIPAHRVIAAWLVGLKLQKSAQIARVCSLAAYVCLRILAAIALSAAGLTLASGAGASSNGAL